MNTFENKSKLEARHAAAREDILEDQFIERSDFDRMFEDISTIQYKSSTVEYADLKPEKQRDKLPIILLGGWAANLDSLRGLAETIYRDDRRVIVLDYTESARANRKTKLPKGVNREIARKAEGLTEVLADIGLEKVDVIAISEGALVVASAAERHPNYFRNLALFSPAGMIGKDNAWGPGGLAWRYFVLNSLENRKIQKESQLSDSPDINMDMSHVTRDLKKYYEEGKAIAHGQNEDLLSDLREQGIGVGILHMNRDVIFPKSRLEKQIRIQEISANADSWSVIANREAGHYYPMSHPEQSATAALQILDDLEASNKTP